MAKDVQAPGTKIGFTLTALALALCSCTATTAGTPTPAPDGTSPASTSGTALGPLGDLQTLSPCSIVSTDTLQADGSASLSVTYDFHTCSVSMRLANGAEGDANIEPYLTDSVVRIAFGQNPPVTLYTAGGFDVKDPTPTTAGRCVRLVEVSPDLAVGINQNSPAADCSFADTVARAVAIGVHDGHATHWAFPVNSVGSINFCDTIDERQIETAVASTPMHRDGGPLRDGCAYGEVSDPTKPYLTIESRLYPAEQPGAGGRPVTVADRMGWQESVPATGNHLATTATDNAYCVMWATGIHWSHDSSESQTLSNVFIGGSADQYEGIELTLYEGGDVTKTCAEVGMIAADVWTLLHQ